MTDSYKATYRQGKRSDSISFESPSLTKAKNFALGFSTSNVTSMKKVVYSKEKNINYFVTNHIETKYNDLLILCVQTKSSVYALKIKFPKKDLTLEQIKEKLKDFPINGEKIEVIKSALIRNNEGFSPNLIKG